MNRILGFLNDLWWYPFIYRSTMEDRVRVLFQNGLQCNEEVQHIKNVYV